MEDVRDRTFTDRAAVDTDGVRFVDCQFESATLRYAGGEHPVFENCGFGDIGWYFHGPALRTIQLLQQVQAGAGDHGSAFIADLFKPGKVIGE